MALDAWLFGVMRLFERVMTQTSAFEAFRASA